MPPTNIPGNIKLRPNFLWINRHETVTRQLEMLYDVWKPEQSSGDGYKRIKMTAESLGWIINEAGILNTEIRAHGGTWSLSPIAVAEKRMINTRPLNSLFPLSQASLSTGYAGNPGKVFFVQCGIQILELNAELKKKNLSLKTTGASNGQTIAGAVSTGTHGAAFDAGSMQDYVVGIHLVTGPGKHVLLERASYPVLSQSFADRIGAEIIRNDELFNAALVSFGSFGIIHALVIETEDIFLLEMNRKRLPVDNSLKNLMNTLDFSGYSERPYHFEVVFNPYDIAGGAYVTEMYKRTYTGNYAKPVPVDGLGPGDDLLAVIGTITDAVPAAISPAVNGLVNRFYGISNAKGTIGEIFCATTVHGRGASMEIGIPLADSSRALEVILGVINTVGPVACIVAFRFVRGSKALLAFTKFDMTCTIEIQAVYSQRSLNFYNALWQELTNQGIAYTFHWGQMNDLNSAKVRSMYGSNVDKWINARKTLLQDKYRRLFNNKTLRECKLDG